MESSGAPSSSSKTRNTVYVSNIPAQAKVQHLLDTFVTFGDIIDIKLPNDPKGHSDSKSNSHSHSHSQNKSQGLGQGQGHRGFAFLTFSNPEDAADAIDNYDLNELPGFVGQGKFLKCSIANPDKFGMGEGGKGRDKPIWQTEEWLQEHGQKDVEEANGTVTES